MALNHLKRSFKEALCTGLAALAISAARAQDTKPQINSIVNAGSYVASVNEGGLATIFGTGTYGGGGTPGVCGNGSRANSNRPGGLYLFTTVNRTSDAYCAEWCTSLCAATPLLSS